MNKFLQLPIEIKVVQYPNQAELAVTFQREALADWCLGLCLLSEGLIEGLVVVERRPATKLNIRQTRDPEVKRISTVAFEPEVCSVELARNQLDYARRFFLKYYRDGVAEVDHIHLEASNAHTGDKNVDLTLKVLDSRPAVSAEEAERRLRG